jgi:hypothetical protein
MGDKQFQGCCPQKLLRVRMITVVKQLPLLRLRDNLNALTTGRMA